MKSTKLVSFALRAAAAAVALPAVFVPRAALAFDRVQPPEISVGHRAGLAGSLASTAYGPSDVSRGGFTLPGPFNSPSDRGPRLADVFPSYSPDNGISPWGMGFSANLEIRRWRSSGSLQYDFANGDELTSPFGRLTRGTDGNFYPVGLDKPVRVVASANDTLVAYHPDGSVWTFGGAARITNGRGTYAWHLTQVRDAVGHVTKLTWTANPSGNLFLSSVEYGGRATSQYRIDLAYEPVANVDPNGVATPKFVDYRSGAPLALDQRVKSVKVSARSGSSGAFVERWHYDLKYVEETVGAAFYLVEVDQTFASGESAPPVRYGYNLKGASFATTQMAEVPQLTQLFQTLGVSADVVQPTRSAVIDADADGNPDLELSDNARTLISQKGSGTADDPLHFEATPIVPSSRPACTGDADTNCVFRGCLPTVSDDTLQPPRMLSQLNPLDTTVEVVDFVYDPDSDRTAVSVCSRDGVRTGAQSVTTNWDQSDHVRFVDLNADHLPDLVRVGFGRYDILPNVASSSSGAIAFGPAIGGDLTDSRGNAITPDAVWVSDMSGDGVPDLVGLYGDSIEVWHGLGNYQFATAAQELRFFDRYGNMLTGLPGYKLIPSDLNKDGLQDYFVTNSDTSSSRFVRYFTNVGGRYVESVVAALDNIPFSASAPVIATLDGSGNTSVTVTDSGKAYSVPLDGPETGLMATADDGRGTVLSFEYRRGPASPGVRHRVALLSAMHVQSSGYDTISYDYRYGAPTVHSLGHFLIGFGQVTRREGDLPSAPLGTQTMTFDNGDFWGGLLRSSIASDTRLPNVSKIETRDYSDATFQGIPYKRLASTAVGWQSADGQTKAVDTTTYDAYASDFCPSQTTLTTASHGKLVTQITRANPAKLTANLHCLEARIVQTGTHADTSLDFTLDQAISRNDVGRVTQIATQGPDGSLVAQVVAYDIDNDPVRFTSPGHGSTQVSYDPATKLPIAVTAPDGVRAIVSSRDPVTDLTVAVTTDRGGAKWTESASYDGQERLSARWNDLGGSSANAPLESYAYSYASTNHPATVRTHVLVDATTGAHRDLVEIFTAKEEKIGTARLGAAGWVIDGFTARSRAHAEQDRFLVGSQPASAAFETIDYATLLGAQPAKIDTASQSTLGLDVATAARLHADVTKATTSSMTVNADGTLSRATLVNGANATTAKLDPSEKLQLAYVDEAGTTYGYAYDALGRLRGVTLPDGTQHRVAYDAYGRVSTITRDGIAKITQAYAAVGTGPSDLLALRTFASAPTNGSSVPQRSQSFTYDAAGRKLTETDTDLTSQAKKTFTFFYDGASPAAPTAKTTLGLLTAITGDGYGKAFSYRADGKLTERTIAIAGFRTVTSDLTYREDGSIKDHNVVVKDASGNVVQTSNHHDDVDAYGRPSAMSVNGSPLATTSYDALNRPAAASFANGDSVTFAYDALTRELLGFDQTRAGNAWSSSSRMKKNDRGFVGQEILGVGASRVLRTYGYSAQGFLTSATDGAQP